MSGHTVEEIEQEKRKYWVVFIALVALTAITVGVSYLHLSTGAAVFIALLVACVKGGLVAGVFMHLISERQAIYAILVLTAVFFVVLMLGPSFTRMGGVVG
ncbi:MAG: cytochrome C oxidase subunit IV family protein [Acidobacteriota bacterium]|nr:cytochrome C oxidase subunit IV family protein [Acidobacteriota bacterium]MDH3525510.1 cytochrome C oxidase subunit IV family protein [Acidobacteriota bacterium]